MITAYEVSKNPERYIAEDLGCEVTGIPIN